MGKTTDPTEPLTRKQAKKASKRRKLEALLRITALNDQDRHALNKTTGPLVEKKITESKRTHEEPYHPTTVETIDLTDADCTSNSGPSPKRLKSDPINADDEEMPLHSDVPSASVGSSEHPTMFPSSLQSLPLLLPQLPQHVNTGAALLFQQNIVLQTAKPFPLIINGPFQLVPALSVPEFWNIPGTCLNPMAISVVPSIYTFGNPFLLPSPNVRIPVFPHLVLCEDQLPAKKTDEIDEELKNLRKSVRTRVRGARAPCFSLAAIGHCASLSTPEEDRIPIFTSDLQRIILRATIRTGSDVEMRCGNFKSVSNISGVKLLLLEGLSLKNVQSCLELSTLLREIFPVQMECIMPTAYEGALLEELAAVPLSFNDRKSLIQKYGSLEVGLRRSNQIFRVMRAFFPIKNRLGSSKSRSKLIAADENPCPTQDGPTLSEDDQNGQNGEYREITTDKFPRTNLLLAAWQMIEEGYPLPLRGNTFKEFVTFGMTKSEYKEVSSSSPMYGLDCEMCLTTIRKHELTRVSVINEKHEVIYDTLVKPPNPIINYLTEYSGITKEMMEGVTTTLQDVQEKLREILEPDAILVGQSLNADLVALQLMHPYVIDTSVIFNLTGDRCRKSKLKYLAKAFLRLDIQHDSAVGHDPTEDATTALKLVQLKLARGLEFGDAVLCQLKKIPFSIPEKMDQDTDEQGNLGEEKNAETKESKSRDDDIAVSVFRYLNRHPVSIVGNPDIIDEYHKYTYIIDKWDRQDSRREKLYRPNLVRGHDELDIVDKAVQCMNQSFCTIAHVQLQRAVSELLCMGDDETTQRFKNIASDFYRSAPEDSLVLVVLGGNSEGANGAVYLAVRKRNFTQRCKLVSKPTLD